MKVYFEKFLQLNEIHRNLIFFGFWLIVTLILYFLILNPQFKKIDKKNSEYVRLKKKTSMLIKAQRDFEKLKRKLKELNKQYEIAVRKLPDSREIPELLLKISSYGKENNLKFLLFKPEKEIKKNFYAIIPISLKFIGSYKSAGMFFYEIGSTTRIVKVKRFKMKKKDKNIYISGTIETYKFIKKANEKKKTPKKKKK